MNFASLEREGVPRRARSPVLAAIANVDRWPAEWDNLIDKALRLPALSKSSRRFLREQWYGDARESPLSLGNRAVHRASNIALIIVLLASAQKETAARKGRLRFRMFTTSADLGVMPFDGSGVDIAAVGRHFDQAARAANVNALGFIDIAVVEEAAMIDTPDIVFHIHAAIRAKSGAFRSQTAERLSSPLKTKVNKLGLKVCKISSKRRDWGRCLSREHVCQLGYYVAKRSCGRKIILDDGQCRRTKTTLHRWTVRQVLRQLECYSHCHVFATTRAVGDGKHWRKSWKRKLLRLLKVSGTSRGMAIDHETLTKQWQRVWSEIGEPHIVALRMK